MKFFYIYLIPLCMAAESDKIVEYINENSIYSIGINKEIAKTQKESEVKEVLNVNVAATFNFNILLKKLKEMGKSSDSFNNLLEEDKNSLEKMSDFSTKHDMFYDENYGGNDKVIQSGQNHINYDGIFFKERPSTYEGNDKVTLIQNSVHYWTLVPEDIGTKSDNGDDEKSIQEASTVVSMDKIFPVTTTEGSETTTDGTVEIDGTGGTRSTFITETASINLSTVTESFHTGFVDVDDDSGSGSGENDKYVNNDNEDDYNNGYEDLFYY